MSSDKKILVAFYSKTEATAKTAQVIQKLVGGDLFRIEPVNPYPEDYQTCVDQATHEKETLFKPEIKPGCDNFDEYDIVFIGSPCWWSTIAGPVRTFISQHSFAKKIVVPFCTHGGGGLSDCAKDIAALVPESTTLAGHGFYGVAKEGDAKKWLQTLKLLH